MHFLLLLMETHLGHEAAPRTGGVVDGIQLLQQPGGVGQTVVPRQQNLHQLAVGAAQQLRLLLDLRPELRRQSHSDAALTSSS